MAARENRRVAQEKERIREKNFRDRMKESSRIQPVFPTRIDVSGDFGGGERASAGGPFDWVGGRIGKFASWLAQDVWPFSALLRLGGKISQSGWKIRVVLAILSGLMLVGATTGESAAWPWGHSLFAQIPGDYGGLVALASGLIIGSMLPRIIGDSMRVAVLLTSVGLALAVAAGCCWLIWEILRAAFA
jgi:hypothetical protein